MIKQFCHLCRDGGKQCLDIDDRREAAMLKIQPKCSVCGRLLVQ
ncbi:MAG: hypothetical protein ABI347_00975 [Nitrososphaera sp.]|jgi:hypothetical protein